MVPVLCLRSAAAQLACHGFEYRFTFPGNKSLFFLTFFGQMSETIKSGRLELVQGSLLFNFEHFICGT